LWCDVRERYSRLFLGVLVAKLEGSVDLKERFIVGAGIKSSSDDADGVIGDFFHMVC
jgi:hypothetical protein